MPLYTFTSNTSITQSFTSKRSKAANMYKSSVVVPEKDWRIMWGIVFTDGTNAFGPRGAKFKIELRFKQAVFIDHLFTRMQHITFQSEPFPCYRNKEKTDLKSYAFWSFLSPTLVEFCKSMIIEGIIKNSQPRLVKRYKTRMIDRWLTDEGFAYAMIRDGTNHKRDNLSSLAVHGLTPNNAKLFCLELNRKFGLNRKVLMDSYHKGTPYIVYPAIDRARLRELLDPYLLRPLFSNKLPRIKD